MSSCTVSKRCVFLLALVFALPAHASDVEHFRDAVQQGKALWQVPGIAVALIDDGEVILQEGFGVTSADGRPVDEHTLFANASTTKAMVSAGILLLVDDGKLELDDPVIDYLPEVHFPEGLLTQQVTVRDLLAHRTGMPSTDFWTFRQLMPLDEQLVRLRRVTPAAGPRERKIYQNTMYEIAGLLIGRLSGQRWDTFLAERLWRPIGMLETYGTRGQIPAGKHHVLPHALVDGAVTAVPFDIPIDREDAAGSAWSSVHDMTKWAQFLLRGGVTEDGQRLLSEESMAQMFEPAQLVSTDDYYPTWELTQPNWRSYALGWYQQDFQGRKIDFHTGSLDGLVAIVGLDRAGNDAVIVLQNMDGSELRHGLLWHAMDHTAADTRRDWVSEVHALYAARDAEREERWQEVSAARIGNAPPSLALQDYFGTYRSDVLGDIRIERTDSGLFLRTGMYDYTLAHWHHDVFTVDYLVWSYPSFATFIVDPKGQVGELEVFGHRFEKLEPEDSN